jgi:hypothetical protein
MLSLKYDLKFMDQPGFLNKSQIQPPFEQLPINESSHYENVLTDEVGFSTNEFSGSLKFDVTWNVAVF